MEERVVPTFTPTLTWDVSPASHVAGQEVRDVLRVSGIPAQPNPPPGMPGVQPTGTVTWTATDMLMHTLGLGTGRGPAGASGYSDGVSGSGATLSEFAHLVQVNGNDSVALVSNAATVRFSTCTAAPPCPVRRPHRPGPRRVTPPASER